MTERKEGFYYVQLTPYTKTAIAHWCNGSWCIPGCNQRMREMHKIYGPVPEMEQSGNLIDLAKDVHWFVSMQRSSDPGLLMLVDKARNILSELEAE